MSIRLIAFTVALGATGCGAAAGGLDRRAPESLDEDWLQGGATITPAHLTRELALGANDPEVSALAREAVERLGGGQLAALAACFSSCPASVTLEGGLTIIKSSDVWITRSIEELAFGTRPAQEDQERAGLRKGRFREIRLVEGPDFILVERTLLPEICIVPRLSVAAAYEAIVHELVHAVHIEPRSGSNLAETVRDEHGFLSAFVMVPGGEVHAYTVGTRARLRLQHQAYRASPLIALFDLDSGEPRVPAPAMAEVILGREPYGLGYADGLLQRTFSESRETALGKLEERSNLVAQVLDERRRNLAIFLANVEVHTHNLAAHEHNLSIAGARGDAALLARSRAGLAEAERGLARTRAMIVAARASEVRLTDQLAALARRRLAFGPPAGGP